MVRACLCVAILVVAACNDDGARQCGDDFVGDSCGNDCLMNSDSCWACGELRYDEDCNCRPVATSCFRPDCSAPEPATEGDYCGEWWWCDRACESGLRCLRALPEQDPHQPGFGSYLTTCQP